MAELNDVDINSALTKNLGTTPTTEIDLQEMQSSSISMVLNTSEELKTDSKGNEGGGVAEEGELLPLNETDYYAGDRSEVESCILKGNYSDLLR